MSQHSDKGVTRGQALCHTAVSQHTVAAHCHNKLSQHTVTASGPPQPCPACLRQTKCTIADPFSGWNKQFPRNVYREDSSTPAEGHGFRGMHSGGMRYKKDLDSRGHPFEGPGFPGPVFQGACPAKRTWIPQKKPPGRTQHPGSPPAAQQAAENINRTSAKSQRFRTMRTAPYMPASFPSPASLIPASRQAWKAAGL